MRLRSEHGVPRSGGAFILVDSPMPVKTGAVGRSLGNVVSDPREIEVGAVHCCPPISQNRTLTHDAEKSACSHKRT